MSTTGHENEAINVQGLKASLQKLKTENLDPNVNKGIVNEATCSTAAGTAAKTVTAPASFSLTSGAAILVKFTNGISVDNATLAVGSTAAKPIYYKGAALEADYVEAGDIIMLKYDGTNYNVVGKLGGRALPEVQIGGTAPTSESEIKLFVDENSDDTVEVYTKAQANILYAGKTDKLPMTGTGAATENNFMAIDANGNIKDSGKNENSFQLKVTDCAMLGGGYAVCSTGAATAAKAVSISNFVLMKGGVIGIRFKNGISINGATLNVSSTGDKPIILDGVALQANVIKENSTVSLQYDGTNWQVLSATQGISSDDELLVDLGLPSGLKWATRNLDITQANGFASSPYQYECSFVSWGNTECHNPNSTSSFQYDWGSSNDTEPYASSSGAALTGNVSLGYDAAHINLGGPWRLPTTEEIAELFNTSNTKFVDANGNNIASSTTNKIITMNGIQGIRLKSLANGKTIFFACTGFGNGTNWYYRSTYGLYWASSLYSSSNASRLSFISGGVDPHSSGPRYFGFPVRAVQ